MKADGKDEITCKYQQIIMLSQSKGNDLITTPKQDKVDITLCCDRE